MRGGERWGRGEYPSIFHQGYNYEEGEDYLKSFSYLSVASVKYKIIII